MAQACMFESLMLTGHTFSADQLGVKVELVLGSALLTVA
jgi:hypothetical protein